MNERTFILADSFDATAFRHRRLYVDLAAPLPLGHHEAIRRGLDLRLRGEHWSYTVIAEIMTEYHGFRRSASWWKAQLREAGAPPRPHGVPFTGPRRKVAA